MWYFLVIFNSKSTKIIITIITHIIVVIIITWFCNTRKNVAFDAQKKLYNLPELGGGGGEVIWAMPERNWFCLAEVFPYTVFLINMSSSPNWHNAILRPDHCQY